MMNKISQLLKLALLFPLLALTHGCGCQGGGCQSNEGTSDSSSSESSVNTEMVSFSELAVENGFVFNSQRPVEVNISFARPVAQTSLSIFLGQDPETNEPTGLLERGELNGSTRFRSLLTVPGDINSLFVVLDGDVYDERQLPIDSFNRIDHIFE